MVWTVVSFDGVKSNLIIGVEGEGDRGAKEMERKKERKNNVLCQYKSNSNNDDDDFAACI